ncbi:hypothetical protein ACFXTH_010595 [Malus domestica]
MEEVTPEVMIVTMVMAMQAGSPLDLNDLYKDEDDRRKLAEMSELQRELILYERALKKDDKSLKEKFRPKWDKGKAPQSRKETPPLPSYRVRSSARSADRAAFKDNALNELRAKRLKQQDPEAHRKSRVASRSQDDRSSGDDAMIDNDDEMSEGLTFDDTKEITIQRLKLAKWFMEPFLEKLIVVCVVRIGIGRSKSGTISGGSSTGRHGGTCSSFGSCGWCREKKRDSLNILKTLNAIIS